jgi:ribonuclease E
MPKSMLVNVTAEEEHRVAIVDSGVLDVFEIETLSRENLKGNIYKVIVEGINPALEAAFVNYGGERAGFLPLDEVNFKLYPSRDGGATGGKGRGARITRHLDKGMEVLVQVIRDSFGTKPPTMSTYYSLPGRYLVLMPGADSAGISRKIEGAEERDRLRKILDALTIPEGFGVIVRTAGMETSPRELQADLEALLELWRNIEGASQRVKAPALIFQERDLVLRTIRDYFTSDIEEILIDDDETYRRVRKFFEAHMPDKADLVRVYTGDKPIFSKHNVEDQIERIFKRVVQLKSGGAISIDQTEALTAIDVNSARSVRTANSEDTAARTNLEAAEEIARQLRLRDIGGLIVIDFIDMQASKHVRQVERAFAEAMAKDKARYDITRISKLGLMEVSRQRIKSTKASSSFMPCPTCSGDGSIRTPEAAARVAFRKIQARVVRGDLQGARVFLPPDVAMYLLNQKRDDLHRLESRYKISIEVEPEEKMKASQFEIEEVRREEEDAAPIVTADTVDDAMAAGTIPSIARPPAALLAPAPITAPAPATPEASVTAEGHRRRRRRRGRGRGRGTEAAGAAPGSGAAEATTAPAGNGSPAAAGFPEDRPAFSEGPEGEEPSGATDGPEEPMRAGPGPGTPVPPRGEPAAPGAEAGPRRRRRRRRRRGHGRREPMPGAPAGPALLRDERGGGNGSAERTRSPEPETNWRERQAPPIAGREPAPPPASFASAPDPPAEGSGPPDPESGGPDAKPRRRWWRRAFRG